MKGSRSPVAILRNLAMPRWLRGSGEEREGVLVDTRGLAGSDGRVVAYGFSAAPGWTTVIDQPTSTVFAGARATLLREGLLLAAVALTASCLSPGESCVRVVSSASDELASRAGSN